MPTSTLERPSTTPNAPVDSESIEDFVQVRRRLLGVAQRIVGNAADAEDIVQEAWLRWQTCDRDEVLNPTAFLVTATTRLALNWVQSARVRRETSVGQWVVEPSACVEDPSVAVEHRDEVDEVLWVLLEQLAPVERAAFVLRHAYDHSYARIAEVLRLSEPNARQVVSRAGRRLRARCHIAPARPVLMAIATN